MEIFSQRLENQHYKFPQLTISWYIATTLIVIVPLNPGHIMEKNWWMFIVVNNSGYIYYQYGEQDYFNINASLRERDASMTVKIRNYHEGSCYLINMGNYLSVYERLVMHLWGWQNKMKSTHNQGNRIVWVFKSPHTNILLCLHTLKIIQGIYWLETEHAREQLQNNSNNLQSFNMTSRL